MVIEDLNKDGYEDIILGGNNTYLLPQFSMIDACNGKILINQKGEYFKQLAPEKTGLKIKGTLRALELINDHDKDLLFALINNKDIQLYTLNTNNLLK